MLILVTSDNHRNVLSLGKLVNRYPHADLYLHAGDSELHDFELEPFLSVRGNCDRYIKNTFRILELENFRIYLFHGNTTKLTDEILSAIAKNHQCNIIIHGHTHVPYYNIYDGVHILCPGSVTSPRSKFGASYALIRLEDQKIQIDLMKVNNEES